MKSIAKDNLLAKVVLFILTLFFVYLLYVFIPIWLFKFSNSQGEGKVISIYSNQIEYSYYNIYKRESIMLRRKISNNDYDYLKAGDGLIVYYSNYCPRYVLIRGIDKQTPVFFTLIAIFIVIVSIMLYLLVLKGKISLRTLLGMKEMD